MIKGYGVSEGDTFQVIYETPVLWAETSKGLKKFWQGHVVEEPSGVYTYTDYWQELVDGSKSKKQTSAPTIIEAKNVGKSNETDPKDQGISEMKSQMKRQIDKGYAEVGQVSQKLVLPMLAHKFSEKSHVVTYPCSIQPKADGCRAMTDGRIMWSRKGIEFPQDCVQHILDELPDLNGLIIDGELILPGNGLLQDTMKAVKKFRPGVSTELLFRVYDVVSDQGYDHRLAKASEIVGKSGEHVKLMTTLTLQSEDDIWPIHEGFVRAGWEGSMVRTHQQGYKAGHRSSSLLKVKDFLEEEFLCTGVEQGTGKFAGAAILVFETPAGRSFKAAPLGTMQERQAYWENSETAVGKRWTIRFQSWTDDKIPFHARAVNIRDEALQG